MAETVEEILARKAAPSNESLEEILARKNVPKVTYPGFGQPEAPPETGFRQAKPGKTVYTGSGSTLADVESPGTVYGRMGRTAADVIVPIAAMEVGGGLVPAALSKARPVVGMIAKTAARALGAGAGSEAVAPLHGEAPSLTRGLKTARNVALTEGLVRGGGYVLGRAGGVEPSAASAAQDRPELLKRAPAKEYAAAGKDIAKTYKTFPETQEHVAYRNLVASKGEVDGMPYVQKMLDSVRPNVDEPVSRLIEKKTASLADDLFQRLAPNGKIDAVKLDDWIRKNLSEPASRVYEKGAGSAWQERLASMRDQLAPQFYRDIGGRGFPPVPSGYVRLYRGQIGEFAPTATNKQLGELDRGRWFSTDPELARFFGPLKYVDVPEDVANAAERHSVYTKSARLLPAEFADKARTLSGIAGPNAAELQAATHETMRKVEAAQKMLPEQTPTALNIQTPSYLRQVLKDSDIGEQVRTRLANLDSAAGTNHLDRVEDLAMRSSWTSQEKAEIADILANVPTIRYERVGLVRAGARSLGRKVTRVTRPSGRIAAVGSTIRGVSQ